MTAVKVNSILLVDDDLQLASALQWILADKNYFVDVANDGEEALTKIKHHKYDAIVCDIVMPRLRGDKFYFLACELNPRLANRFIMMTGFITEPRVDSFLSATGISCLTKPFPMESLIQRLEQLLSANNTPQSTPTLDAAPEN